MCQIVINGQNMINKINTALEKYLNQLDYKYKNVIFDAMSYSLLADGKRIRPLLCLEWAKLFGANLDDAIPFACAVEMIHCYSLIHDDLPCMDNDDLRRGKPTNHKVFGENFALLAGDALLNLAFETMLSSNISAEKIVKASRVMTNHSGVNGMIGGQCIDLQSQNRVTDIDELESMNMGKTVAIISAACEMGVIVGGGNELQIASARNYAVGVGMAFQIRDDILDVIGDSKDLGKNTGMDEHCNKYNYVTLLGVEKSQELVEKYTNFALSQLCDFDVDTSFLRDFAIKMQTRTK